MKKLKGQQGFVVPLLIIVLALLAIGGGVYIYKNKNASNSNATIIPNDNIVGNDRDAHGCIGSAGYSWCEVKNKCLRVWEEKCEVATATVGEIANWKTYNNTDFSLKYPATWYLNISSPGFISITNEDLSLVPGSDAPTSRENISINISVYPPGKYNNFSTNETLESWSNKIGLSDKQNILVDGTKAIRGKIIYTGKEESGYYKKGQLSGDYVLVILNGKGYQITYSPFDSKFISTFDQILSTFKFTSSIVVVEKQIGYIKSISSKDGKNYLVIDYVQWVNCTSDASDSCPNDYKIVNDNPLLRTFPIASDAEVKLQTYSYDSGGNFNWNQVVPLATLTNALNGQTKNYHAKNLLYWITLDNNGVVTSIAEQYRP